MLKLEPLPFQTSDAWDYTPLASIAYNIAILCIKIFAPTEPQENESEFYRYARAKDLTRTLIGVLPIIGNIFLAIFDATTPKKEDLPPPPSPKNPPPNPPSSQLPPPNPLSSRSLPPNPPKIKKEEPPTWEDLLKLSESNFSSFESAPYVTEQSLNKNLEFVKCFVGKNGSNHYFWVHEDLQNDTEVVSQLLQQTNPNNISDVKVQEKLLDVLGEKGKTHLLNLFKKERCPYSLSSLPEKVHKDLDFINTAIDKCRVGESLIKSEDFILFLLEKNLKIPHLDPNNPLTENSCILEELSKKDVNSLYAIFQNKDWPLSSPLLPEKEKKDPKFIDLALRTNRLGNFKEDHTLLQECLKRDGKNLKYLPDEIRSDVYFISIALAQNADATKHVLPQTLARDLSQRSPWSSERGLKLEEYGSRGRKLNKIFPFTPPEVKNDPWCVYRAVSQGNADAITNRFFATEAQQKNYPLPEGKSLANLQSAGLYESQDLKQVLWDGKTDQEIRDILRGNSRLYWCAPESIKEDLAFLAELFKTDPSVLLFSSTSFGERYSLEIFNFIQNPDLASLFNNKDDPFTLSINRESLTEDVITKYPILFPFIANVVQNDEVLLLHCLNQISELYYFLDESRKTNIDFYRQYFSTYVDPSYFITPSRSKLFSILNSENKEMANTISKERESSLKEEFKKISEENKNKENERANTLAMNKFKAKTLEEELKQKEEREKIEEEIRKQDMKKEQKDNWLFAKNLMKDMVKFQNNDEYKETPDEPEVIKNARSYFGSLKEALEMAAKLSTTSNDDLSTYFPNSLKKSDNKPDPYLSENAQLYFKSFNEALEMAAKLSTDPKAAVLILWSKKHFPQEAPTDPNQKTSEEAIQKIPYKKLVFSLHPDKIIRLSESHKKIAYELCSIFTGFI